MRNEPSPNKIIQWFDPRYRNIGSWAFILNRITGLGLTFYLLIHLIALGQLVKGPEAYGSFIAMVQNPIYKLGELLVIAACFIHGFNGIRIALNSVGVAVKYQKHIFIVLMIFAVCLTLFFAYRLFS